MSKNTFSHFDSSDIRSLKKMSSALRQVLPANPRAFKTRKAQLGFEIDPLEVLKMVMSGDISNLKIRQEVIPDEYDPHRDDFEERRHEAYNPNDADEEEADEDDLFTPPTTHTAEYEEQNEASVEKKIEIEEKSIIRVEMLPALNPTLEVQFATLYRLTFKKYRPVYFHLQVLEDNDEEFVRTASVCRSGMIFLGMALDFVENQDYYEGFAETKVRKKAAHNFSKPRVRQQSSYQDMFEFYQIGLYVGTETMMLSNVIDEPNLFAYYDMFDIKDFNAEGLLNLKREEVCALLTMRVHNLKTLLANEIIEPANHREAIFKDVVMAVLFFPPRTFAQKRMVVQTLHRAGYSAQELTRYLNCITNIEVAHSPSIIVRIKGEPTEEETEQNRTFMQFFQTDPRWTAYQDAKAKTKKTGKKKK